MTSVKIRKEDLGAVFNLLSHDYRLIGPKILNNTIVLSDISPDEIPAGYRDHHGAGSYRLEQGAAKEIFSFSPGPDSFKKFLHPSSEETFSFRKTVKALRIELPLASDWSIAFMGARACDLAALKLLDKVFLEGPFVEQGYEKRRKGIFIAAVNCIYPGENCFCDSMGTGPEVKEGFDIVLTETGNSFLLEAGSESGNKVLEGLPRQDITKSDLEEKEDLISRGRGLMKKSMMTKDLPDVIYKNMEHPRWAEIAKKDLECGNCTMVCPTCFCNSSYDVLSLKTITSNLTDYSGARKKRWDSCFSKNFARVHGGNFRPSLRARYRHWMTHKLAYWIEQFGRPGCVGCGRCITWCPVGIDITHELEELRRVR